MTKNQRARYAREARKLAFECAAGTAPNLIPGLLFDSETGLHCVAGLLGKRFGGTEYFAFTVCGDANLGLLIEANNHATDADRHGAVVFPLLALADELEAL